MLDVINSVESLLLFTLPELVTEAGRKIDEELVTEARREVDEESPTSPVELAEAFVAIAPVDRKTPLMNNV